MDMFNTPKHFPNVFLVVDMCFGTSLKLGFSSSNHVFFGIMLSLTFESSNVKQHSFTLLPFKKSSILICGVNVILAFAYLVSSLAIEFMANGSWQGLSAFCIPIFVAIFAPLVGFTAFEANLSLVLFVWCSFLHHKFQIVQNFWYFG